jgi:signal transduction histidine kinase
MNFIDNALYYTSQGGVKVYLKKDKENFIFEVHDTGIGVPLEQQKNLFEKFYRADNARTVRPDGTGLGIYLAKRVIEDHGGRIIFHSEMGKGSVFGFTFPLKKSEAKK